MTTIQYQGMRKRVVYYYRGQIERVRRGGRYAWYDGYSATGPSGGVLFPWMTKTECRADAKAQNAVAVFVERDHR